MLAFQHIMFQIIFPDLLPNNCNKNNKNLMDPKFNSSDEKKNLSICELLVRITSRKKEYNEPQSGHSNNIWHFGERVDIVVSKELFLTSLNTVFML